MIRTWCMVWIDKKSPAILTDNRAWLRLHFSVLINIQSYIYDNRCVCLKFVVAQVVCCEHFVTLHILYHHVLAIELLDDDFIIR